MLITTVTQKGQVTIPAGIRKLLGISAGSKVRFVKEGKDIKLKVAADFFSFKGSVEKKRKFSQSLLRKERKAAEETAVNEYLKRVKK